MDKEYQNYITETVQFLMKPMIGEVDFEYTSEGDQWRINIKTENAEVLTARKNEVLSALQHVLRVLVHKKYPEDRTHFLLDVNSQRKVREDFINEEVPRIAKENILINGETVIVNGLSSYERKIIHRMLLEVDGMETTSVGDKNNRRLIIRPTSDTGSGGIDRSIVIDIDRVISTRTA